ncbi:MAG: 4Fe-4S binding protein [Dehalococcoidia bacterium]|nr:4Fe-4S binding protein [Dehalococcoidia bacterium]
MLKIDTDKCVGCGACVDVCPQEAISIQNGIAIIDQKLCMQCGNCTVTCPADAVYVLEPVYAQSRKGGDEMRGRGWFGRRSPGWGIGNPYPFCRFYPWLPRRWWAYGQGPYPQTMPSYYPVYRPYLR